MNRVRDLKTGKATIFILKVVSTFKDEVTKFIGLDDAGNWITIDDISTALGFNTKAKAISFASSFRGKKKQQNTPAMAYYIEVMTIVG